jgi:endoglucanase
MILMPGTDFSALGSLAGTYADALGGVINPDKSTTNLIYDVHQYLDSQYDPPNTGTHTECGKNGVDSIQALADYLRSNNRQA